MSRLASDDLTNARSRPARGGAGGDRQSTGTEGAGSSVAAASAAVAEPLELIVGRRVLEGLRKGNDVHRARGDQLTAAIRTIMAAHAGPVPLRGADVLAQLPPLDRQSVPTVRTVQRHMRRIREATRVRFVART